MSFACLMAIAECTCGSAKGLPNQQTHTVSYGTQWLLWSYEKLDFGDGTHTISKSSLFYGSKGWKTERSECDDSMKWLIQMLWWWKHKSGQFKREYAGKNSQRKNDKKEKENRFCDHCNGKEHTMETCFKLKGYPDWYKDLKWQHKRLSNRDMVNMVETPPD